MKPATSLMAVDVAILLPQAINERARNVNSLLWTQRPDGFRFDETHLPHLTLAQQFVRAGNLPALTERIGQVLRGAPPVSLHVTAFGGSEPVVHFSMAPTPALQRLHETLMDALQPLEESEGSIEDFYSEGELARDKDLEWVGQYRSRASYAHFDPHITLGFGTPPKFEGPFEFTAIRVALCRLGRFCTCRAVLREWKL